MLNIAAMSAVLKVRYLGHLRKTFNNATVLWSKIEKKVMKISGKNFTIALHTGRTNSAALGLGEYEDLPEADAQEYSDCIVPNKYIYSTLEVSGPSMAASRDSVGSFVESLESEVDGLQRDTKRAMNRIIHGPGIDILAYVQAGAAAAAVSGFIDDNQGNAFVHLQGKRVRIDIVNPAALNVLKTPLGVTAAGLSGPQCWIELGQRVDSTKYEFFLFAAKTGTATQPVVAGKELVDGDLIVPYGNVNSAGVSTTPMGIAGIISDQNPLGLPGGLQGIPVLGKPWWQAQVFGNGGSLRQLDLTDMQEVIDAIAINTDYTESDIGLMMCNYPVRRAYFKAMLAERRQVNTMKLDGGWKALDYNGMPFVVDSQCRRNVIYYIVMETLGLLRTSDFDWMDKDGSYLYRTNNKDAYKATLFHYGNLAAYDRNGNGLLSDILEA